ncbi:MAG: biotin/acetyl-CoA-carboxylase ligase, partial [Thermoleophilia bacterium]|nr:biotin/acetyl-CoA-carboxylase ligase [Thermoleophilia bacterium]
RIVVLAARQEAGRGRSGRAWQDPPGAALLLSHLTQGPLPVAVLDRLPERVAELLLEAFEQLAPGTLEQVAWKAPNDLVAREDGAKLAGILVDVRTRGDVVEELCVGVGANLGGAAFVTRDGRQATTLEALTGVAVSPRAVAELLAVSLAPR